MGHKSEGSGKAYQRCDQRVYIRRKVPQSREGYSMTTISFSPISLTNSQHKVPPPTKGIMGCKREGDENTYQSSYLKELPARSSVTLQKQHTFMLARASRATLQKSHTVFGNTSILGAERTHRTYFPEKSISNHLVRIK